MNVTGFDEKFYIKAYPDAGLSKEPPVRHYMLKGYKFSRLKSVDHFNSLYPEFDPAGYYHSNSDLHKLTPEQRMSHYHHTGKKEGRKCAKEHVSQSLKDKLIVRNEMDTFNKKQVQNYFKSNILTDISIPYINDNFIFLPNKKLLAILEELKGKHKIYVVLNDWGLPAFGGGEYWMIDTMKWMHSINYHCIYLFFYDHRTGSTFSDYHVTTHDYGTFIEFPLHDKLYLMQFLVLLKPSIISHQGNSRLQYMKIANLINCPFISGFCFWQDIIDMHIEKEKDPAGYTVPFNKNMLTNALQPNPNFQILKKHSDKLYVCGEFPNDIIAKVHGEDEKLSVIHTITDESHFLITSGYHPTYVTVINISRLKGGYIVEDIIKNTSIDIPFYIIDSQKSDKNAKVTKGIETILLKRNAEVRRKNEKEHTHIKESIYTNDHIDNLKEIYSKTRILLIPSLVDETFCRVAYEGMHNSIPILSTSNGNLKYLLKGYANFLDENPKSWSSAINKYFSNNEKLKEMSERKKNSYNSKEKFIDMVENIVTKGIKESHSKIANIGIFAPWCDQGLGIQAREYRDLLEKLGYHVSIFSPYPYACVSDKSFKMQTDSKEWRGDVYYSSNTREEISDDEFLNYLSQSKISKFIILEICYGKVFELAKICKMLSIEVIAIPNLEIVRHTELPNYQYFDKILTNNKSSYDFFLDIAQNKNSIYHLGFRTLRHCFSLNLKDIPENDIEFFCCGGLNSISRKNIDKIYKAFLSLNAKLYIYIQGIQKPSDLKEKENIKIEIGSKSYSEIAHLYKKHDIFIHLGTHEGLGLGFYEAIASGCPVVTIDCPPNNEIIEHSKNGWLVPNYEFIDMTDNDKGVIYKSSVRVEDIITTIKSIIRNPRMKKTDMINYNINKFPINNYFNAWKTALK